MGRFEHQSAAEGGGAKIEPRLCVEAHQRACTPGVSTHSVGGYSAPWRPPSRLTSCSTPRMIPRPVTLGVLASSGCAPSSWCARQCSPGWWHRECRHDGVCSQIGAGRRCRALHSSQKGADPSRHLLRRGASSQAIAEMVERERWHAVLSGRAVCGQGV
jgi:hypothetical protein